MVHVETNADRCDGITLVEGWAKNDGDGHRRIAIESELDGPIWPPRREGVPERGWDREEGRLTVTLSPGERYGFGFATPAAPSDPPVSLVGDEPADPSEGIERSPAGVVRALGDPSPPVEVRSLSEERPDDDRRPTTIEDGMETTTGVDDPDRQSPRESDDSTGGPSGTGGTGSEAIGGYPAVTAWLSAVEDRIERSNAEGDASDRAGLADDADRLRSVAGWAVRLAERADQTRCRSSGRGPE